MLVDTCSKRFVRREKCLKRVGVGDSLVRERRVSVVGGDRLFRSNRQNIQRCRFLTVLARVVVADSDSS